VYVNWFKTFIVYTTAVTAKSENACANCDGSVVDPSRATIHVNGPVHSAISELMDSVDTLLVLFKETNKCNTQIPTSNNNRFVPLFFSLHPFSTTRVSGNLIATDDFENGLLQQSHKTKLNQTFYLQRAKISTKH